MKVTEQAEEEVRSQGLGHRSAVLLRALHSVLATALQGSVFFPFLCVKCVMRLCVLPREISGCLHSRTLEGETEKGHRRTEHFQFFTLLHLPCRLHCAVQFSDHVHESRQMQIWPSTRSVFHSFAWDVSHILPYSMVNILVFIYFASRKKVRWWPGWCVSCGNAQAVSRDH